MSCIHVVAGALFNARGEILIAQRPPGKHMAGGWEFPGGKVSADEPVRAALTRELKEELAIEVIEAQQLIDYRFNYSDRSVHLDLWHVRTYRGEPVSAEGQAIKWIAVADLDQAGLLDADRPMIPVLQKLYAAKDSL